MAPTWRPYTILRGDPSLILSLPLYAGYHHEQLGKMALGQDVSAAFPFPAGAGSGPPCAFKRRRRVDVNAPGREGDEGRPAICSESGNSNRTRLLLKALKEAFL